jgi:nucleoside-diphosphate-sugar epimerase
MKVLVTGAAGASGSYFCDYLRVEHPRVEVQRLDCNLLKPHEVWYELGHKKPDRIFHFAAKADIARSFTRPLEFFHNNIIGTGNLLQGVMETVPQARVLLVSSCEVYGPPQPEYLRDGRICEDHPLAPISPYAASKAAQEMIASAYVARGMHIVTSRMFNCINPRKPNLFSTQWARQVAMIEYQQAKELRHGNLDSARTLLDIRDVVRGYWMLLEHGLPGLVYNIGAEKETTLREVLEILRNLTGVPIPAVEDPALLRPTDIKTQVADSSLFLAATQWRPKYTLEQSIGWLLEEQRKYVGRSLEKLAKG